MTDFGVAKLTAGEATTSGQLLGTPAFMPPEQFTRDARFLSKPETEPTSWGDGRANRGGWRI